MLHKTLENTGFIWLVSQFSIGTIANIFPHLTHMQIGTQHKKFSRVFYGQHFPIFGLNLEIYRVNLRVRSEYGKIGIRKKFELGYF